MLLQILSKEKLFQGKFMKLWGTKFLDKSGKEQLWEWISKKDVVAILPFTKEGELILIKSFRVPIEGYCIETPAGLLDKPDENKEDAARRELLEETGYKAGEIVAFPPFWNTPGNMNNQVYPFVALNVEKVSDTHGDDTEDIEVIKIPHTELFDLYEKSEETGINFNIRILALYEIAKRKGLI